jgi:F0F1-type ATP synthase assembly protein I
LGYDLLVKFRAWFSFSSQIGDYEMKLSQFFRPMLLLGVFLIAVAVFTWMRMPNLRTSPLGMLGIIIAVAVGIAAIMRSNRDLVDELRRNYEDDDDQKGEE